MKRPLLSGLIALSLVIGIAPTAGAEGTHPSEAPDAKVATPTSDQDSSQTPVTLPDTPVVSTTALANGSVRIQRTASTPSTAQTYVMDVSVPTGMSLRMRGQDAVLTDGSTTYAEFSQPTAHDATGRTLPATYAIRGDSVVETVDTTTAAMPVVTAASVSWKTAVGCAAELALLVPAVAPLKYARAVAKLEALAKKSATVARAIRALGGSAKAAQFLAKYEANALKARLGWLGKPLPTFPLTTVQKGSARALAGVVGNSIWELLGFESCVALAKELG